MKKGREGEFGLQPKLLELLEQFYIISGLRIWLLDREGEALFSYPPQGTSVLHCHAGAAVVSVPIAVQGETVGYLVAGQVEEDEKQEQTGAFPLVCGRESVPLSDPCTSKRLRAATTLLEACASHIQLKELFPLGRKSVAEQLEAYVETHLNEELSVTALCQALGISRTNLYHLIEQQIGGGIAAFVRQKRMARAKALLQLGFMTTEEIARAVGFSDYRYFLRVFKNTYGISPSKLQKIYQTQGYKK